MMKKSMKLLLTLILVFLICAGSVQANMRALYGGDAQADIAAASQKDSSGGEAQAEGPVGVWKLLEITGEKPLASSTIQDNEKLGMVVYLEVRDDGTFMISVYKQESEGTWDENGLSYSGIQDTYTLEGDTLKIQEGSAEMIFERSSMEAIDEVMGFKSGVLDESVSYSDKEETILDTEEVSMTITGYKADKTGFHVFLRGDNKTDQKRTVSADKTILNKYSVNTNWAVLLEPKGSKESDMVFSPQKLEKCGISAVDEIILQLSVSDSESYKFLQRELMAAVYPTGKKAEDIKSAERKPVDKEQIVVDNEYCTFVIEGVDPAYSLGYAVNCYCENKTDRKLTFMLRDEKLNGQDASGLLAVEILPGTKDFPNVIFMKNSLEKAGIKIEDITKIQGTLRVYDEDRKDVVNTEFAYEP